MKKGAMPFRRLAWVAAVELALLQPAMAQESTEAAPAEFAQEAPAAEVVQEVPAADLSAPQAVEGEAAASSEGAEAAPAEAAAAEGEDGESAGPRNRMLEEIVVTATKREENLQEVASSVQAFSAAMLDAQGVSDIKDMGQITPGLQYYSMAS